jgi:GT2 family glycosyltransferase
MDVMVPTHNHLELTITCLERLYQFTRSPFHLIIIDDSTDLTPLWLTQFCKDHEDVTYIHSATPYKTGNCLFIKALEYVKTPYMATVMNSVNVEPEWELGALQLFQNDPKIGIVGMKCLLHDGTIESAGIKLSKWLPCDIGRGLRGHRLSFTHEVDAVQWAFAMLRVEAVKGILEADVFHGFRGWDDIDNCMVVKKGGWKVVYCGAGAGYHQPRATRGTDSEKGCKENIENGQIFMKRWGFWEEFLKENPDGLNVHNPPKDMPVIKA